MNIRQRKHYTQLIINVMICIDVQSNEYNHKKSQHLQYINTRRKFSRLSRNQQFVLRFIQSSLYVQYKTYNVIHKILIAT